MPSPTASFEEIYRPYYNVFVNLPEIHTQRLIIRRARMEDAKDIFEYSKDESVAKHVLWSAHTSISQTKGYIQYLQKLYKRGEAASMVICLKETGKAIGTIGFMNINVEHSSGEMGYSLAKNMWNKGYMTEAVEAMIDFGFYKLRLNRIEAQHEVENPASGRVLEKAGMKFEAILHQRLFNKGKFVDVKLYSILFYDYMKNRI